MEVCVDCIQSAVNAMKAGASRIELCASLNDGGLTPSLGVLKVVKSLVTIPVFVMVRPHSSYDFTYLPDEIRAMELDIESFKQNGADGFVFGILDYNGNVDEETCKKLLTLADPLPCTFHRAFDLVSDPYSALETIIDLGFKRILTSGQKKFAEEGVPLIKELVQKANGRIIIMPGAGLNPLNLAAVLKETGAKEFHGSGGKAVNCTNKTIEEIFEQAIYIICDTDVVKRMVRIAKEL